MDYSCEPIDSLLVEQETLQDKARFYDSAESPQWSRETAARNENKKQLRLIADEIGSRQQ